MCSSDLILLSSLDLGRYDLVANAVEGIGRSIADADRVRTLLADGGRFRDPGPAMLASPDVVALDPLHIVVDTRSGGVPGYDARQLLESNGRIHVEMATDSVIVGIVGAGSRLDVEHVVKSLHALPVLDLGEHAPIVLPPSGPRELDLRTAYLGSHDVVPAEQAVGRVSADSLAAYPPGVANVLPGEVITSEVVNFLRDTAASPYGWVRGAIDASLDHFRVVAR